MGGRRCVHLGVRRHGYSGSLRLFRLSCGFELAGACLLDGPHLLRYILAARRQGESLLLSSYRTPLLSPPTGRTSGEICIGDGQPGQRRVEGLEGRWLGRC